MGLPLRGENVLPYLLLLLLFSSNKVQGLLAYSILRFMVQLHWLHSELEDEQAAPPHTIFCSGAKEEESARKRKDNN